jgi:hypothetical protein
MAYQLDSLSSMEVAFESTPRYELFDFSNYFPSFFIFNGFICHLLRSALFELLMYNLG